MRPTKILVDAIRRNYSTTIRFIETITFHNGKLNPANLFKIREDQNGVITVTKANEIDPDTRSIVIGIEPCNSYSPLYELDYFLMGLFLTTVATALPLSEYKKIKNTNLRLKRIGNDLLHLNEADIALALKSPKVAIVGILTDDIEPYRYRKNQLWGISKSSMKKRCIDVAADEMGVTTDKYSDLRGILWTTDDEENSDTAIKNAKNLCEAKITQSYLTIKKFLRELDINIEKLLFLFSLSPNNDVRTLGPESPFLQFLLEFHSTEQYLLLRKILNWNYPRIIQVSCPRCGESSKKIINGQIKGPDKKLIRLICSEKKKRFKNEFGMDFIEKKGCNNRWDLQLPSTTQGLRDLLVNGFGLYFPVNSLIWIINGISVAPSALLFTDAGFYIKNKSVHQVQNLPIGDHPDLLVHMVTLQKSFLRGDICPQTFNYLKDRNLLVNNEPLLLGHQSPTKLLDPVIYTLSSNGQKFHITDSSVFAAMKHGLSPEDILARSLNIVYFPTDKLIALNKEQHREKSFGQESEIAGTISKTRNSLY